MKIKVCGMRDADNVQQVAQLGVDMMGFIFYPKSPRYFEGLGQSEDFPLPRTDADKTVKRVGVFANDTFENIELQTLRLGLDAVQFHGGESPDFCKKFQEEHEEFLFTQLKPWLEEQGIEVKTKPFKLIKAISVSTAEDIQKYKEYVGAVDYFLFDTKCKAYGGSGEQFDWSVLDAYDGDVPFLLSGGIGPEDAERVKEFHHPMCIGIDLNSKFEVEPGLKNVEKLGRFISQIRGI